MSRRDNVRFQPKAAPLRRHRNIVRLAGITSSHMHANRTRLLWQNFRETRGALQDGVYALLDPRLKPCENTCLQCESKAHTAHGRLRPRLKPPPLVPRESTAVVATRCSARNAGFAKRGLEEATEPSFPISTAAHATRKVPGCVLRHELHPAIVGTSRGALSEVDKVLRHTAAVWVGQQPDRLSAVQS